MRMLVVSAPCAPPRFCADIMQPLHFMEGICGVAIDTKTRVWEGLRVFCSSLCRKGRELFTRL